VIIAEDILFPKKTGWILSISLADSPDVINITNQVVKLFE
jgi:hypothetical protein